MGCVGSKQIKSDTPSPNFSNVATTTRVPLSRHRVKIDPVVLPSLPSHSTTTVPPERKSSTHTPAVDELSGQDEALKGLLLGNHMGALGKAFYGSMYVNADVGTPAASRVLGGSCISFLSASPSVMDIWEVPRSKLASDCRVLLGVGGFGQVYEGFMYDTDVELASRRERSHTPAGDTQVCLNYTTPSSSSRLDLALFWLLPPKGLRSMV